MSDEHTRARAGEYVLGTLTPEEREAVDRDLEHDESLRREVSFWQNAFAELEEHGSPAADSPSPSVWQAIEQSLDALEIPGSVTIRAGAGEWKSYIPGVAKKLLFVDEKAGTESYLLRLDPGARLPSHRHALAEECAVLSGSLEVGSMRISAGDFHVALAGHKHPVVRSKEGAVVYLRSERTKPGWVARTALWFES